MKLLISTNQLNEQALQEAHRLKCNGAWFISANTPKLKDKLWQEALAKIGNIYISEDGGISPAQLFDAHTISINFTHLLKLVGRAQIRKAFVYYENPHTNLTALDLERAYNIQRKKIIVLFRGNHQEIIRPYLRNAFCGGVCIEASASLKTFQDYQIPQALHYLATNGSKPFYLLLPPGTDKSKPYEERVLECLNTLRKYKWVTRSTFHLILAVYERQNNNVKILGEQNSLEQAIKVATRFCK